MGGRGQARRRNQEGVFNPEGRVEEWNADGSEARCIGKERLRAVFDAPEPTGESRLTIAHQMAISQTGTVTQVRADRIAAEANHRRGVADYAQVCRVAGGHQRPRVAGASDPPQPFHAKHIARAITIAAIAEARAVATAALVAAATAAAIAAAVEKSGLHDA